MWGFLYMSLSNVSQHNTVCTYNTYYNHRLSTRYDRIRYDERSCDITCLLVLLVLLLWSTQ